MPTLSPGRLSLFGEKCPENKVSKGKLEDMAIDRKLERYHSVKAQAVRYLFDISLSLLQVYNFCKFK